MRRFNMGVFVTCGLLCALLMFTTPQLIHIGLKWYYLKSSVLALGLTTISTALFLFYTKIKTKYSDDYYDTRYPDITIKTNNTIPSQTNGKEDYPAENRKILHTRIIRRPKWGSQP